MSYKILDYALDRGYINNWLLAGPAAVENADISAAGSMPAALPSTLGANYADLFSEAPVDRGKIQLENKEIVWNYYRCQPDHLVSVSGSALVRQSGFAWAYSRVVLPEGAKAAICFASSTSAEIWVNGALVGTNENGAQKDTILANVKLGTSNDIAVKLTWETNGPYVYRFGLRLLADDAGDLLKQGKVQLNTQSKYPARQQIMEEALEQAYLDEVVNYRGAHFNLNWNDEAAGETRYAYQVQDDRERIYVEGSWDVEPGKSLDIGHTIRLNERPYRIVLRSPAKEYFEMGMRYQRSMPLYVLDNAYSNEPYGDYGSRHTAALEDAARRDDDLFAEIAKIGLNRWEKVDWKVIERASQRISRSEVGSENLLLGGLGLLFRKGEQAEFNPESAEMIRQAALVFDYRHESYSSESRVAAALACAVLAGQKYPADQFSLSELNGEGLRIWAEGKLLELLREKGQSGFAEWGSDQAYERWIIALSHLAGLAENETLSDLAAVLLDKTLFLLAADSFKGSLATAQAEAHADVKSGQLKACAGIQRMLWGMGVFTRDIQGLISLACSEYEFPSFLAQLAVNEPAEFLAKECHRTFEGEANLVVYKTPDFALSSVQDYYPGSAGGSEHIWQATMGTEALVFTNHPAGMQDIDAALPGFWVGNSSRPRVIQHNDALIALYRLPAEDWLGYTHAYFPVHAFDEYRLENGWAFAAKGGAFLAITAKAGFDLTTSGLGAFRELRSYGSDNAWVCLMGSTAQYGDFRAFQKKIQKLPLEWLDLGVKVNTPRGQSLELNWEGDLLVDGTPQATTGFGPIDNPYCHVEPDSKVMDINFEGLVLRLNFE